MVFPPTYWHSRNQNPLDCNSWARVPGSVHVLHYRGRDVKQLLSRFWDFTACLSQCSTSIVTNPVGHHPLPACCWLPGLVPVWSLGQANLREGPSSAHENLVPLRARKMPRGQKALLLLTTNCSDVTRRACSLPLSLPLHPDSTQVTLSKVRSLVVSLPT